VIVGVGLSHHTAPIEVRERLALSEEDVRQGLEELAAHPAISEVFAIATCNRVEVMAVAREETPTAGVEAEQALRTFLLRRSSEAASHLYCYRELAAVKHLYRIASSLDSLVVGEPQILGQVKQAVELGKLAGTFGSSLHGLVNRALRCAKRVRSETMIGAGQVSVPSVALDLARQIFGELRERHVLLVGTGDMGTTVAKLLTGEGAQLLVIGRTHEKAQAVADAYGGTARPWQDLAAALVEVDVVVSSTAAQQPVITRAMVVAASRKRRGRPLFLIDVAVPRDVEPGIDELDEVFLYNVDDLSNVVASSRSERQQQAAAAEAIVEQEAADYSRWTEREQVTPAVVALRSHVSQVLNAELDRSLKGKLRHLGAAEREALEKMMEAAVNKLLHLPTQRLRIAADSSGNGDLGTEELVGAVRELFGLSAGTADGADSAFVQERRSRPQHNQSTQQEAGESGTADYGGAGAKARTDERSNP
jgi:glutamyl-tRNA reductase